MVVAPAVVFTSCFTNGFRAQNVSGLSRNGSQAWLQSLKKAGNDYFQGQPRFIWKWVEKFPYRKFQGLILKLIVQCWNDWCHYDLHYVKHPFSIGFFEIVTQVTPVLVRTDHSTNYELTEGNYLMTKYIFDSSLKIVSLRSKIVTYCQSLLTIWRKILLILVRSRV